MVTTQLKERIQKRKENNWIFGCYQFSHSVGSEGIIDSTVSVPDLFSVQPNLSTLVCPFSSAVKVCSEDTSANGVLNRLLKMNAPKVCSDTNGVLKRLLKMNAQKVH
jgi:hypothetical protein